MPSVAARPLTDFEASALERFGSQLGFATRRLKASLTERPQILTMLMAPAREIIQDIGALRRLHRRPRPRDMTLLHKLTELAKTPTAQDNPDAAAETQVFDIADDTSESSEGGWLHTLDGLENTASKMHGETAPHMPENQLQQMAEVTEALPTFQEVPPSRTRCCRSTSVNLP